MGLTWGSHIYWPRPTPLSYTPQLLTASLYPTLSLCEGKRGFQQPLERRVPATLSFLDPVQLRPSSEFLGWGTVPHCGRQNRNTPIGSWIWKLSHQGVELISEDHRDIARLKSEERSKGAWDRRTEGLWPACTNAHSKTLTKRANDGRDASQLFDLQHWIKVSIVIIPVLGKRKREDHRFKAILGYVVTRRPAWAVWDAPKNK